MQKPLGERVMPMLYVQKFMEKGEDILWEDYCVIANDEYISSQLQQIEDNKKRQAEIESQRAFEEKQRKEREAQEQEQEHVRLANEAKEKECQADLLRRKKADEERKKQEEAEKQRRIAEKKRELEEKERQNAHQQFKNILPGMQMQGNGGTPNTLNGVKVKVEPGDTTIPNNDNPFGTLPRKPKSVEDKLVQIGELIIDKDVLFALENFKKMGSTMKKRLDEIAKEKGNTGDLARTLFPPTNENDDESGEPSPMDTLPIKKEPDQSFSSPKPRLFDGLKRMSEESFCESGKKSRPRTPMRTAINSPRSQIQSPLDLYKAQSDLKSKTADQGNTFLKKKKITPANMKLIFDYMHSKKRDIIKFSVTKNSFYAIIAFYVDNLGLIPNDLKPGELKSRLYNFVMKNHEYTKVNISITNVLN